MARKDANNDVSQRFEFLDDLGRDPPLRLISAFDNETGETVSLDILEPTSSAQRRKVLTRARAASTFRHPDIFAIRDILSDHDPPIIVRDHDRLTTLAEQIRAEGAWSPHAAIRLTAKIATVLDRAHARRLVHGHLTPWQLRRADPSASFKISGFGRPLRQIDLATVDLDELRYMAPERLDGASADKASDLFSLGLIFYTLLTGRHAFDASDRTLLAAQIAEATPTPARSLAPNLPQAVIDIVERALLPEPGLRFRNGNDFSEALEHALSTVQPSDPPATPKSPPRPSSRAGSRLTTIGMARTMLLVIAVIGFAGILYAWLKPHPQVVLTPPVDTTLPLPRLGNGVDPDGATETPPWPTGPSLPDERPAAVRDWREFAATIDSSPCTRVEASEVGDRVILFGMTDDSAMSFAAQDEVAAIPTIMDMHWSKVEAGSQACQLLDAIAAPGASPSIRLLRAADGRVPAEYEPGDLLVLDVDAPLGTATNAAGPSARRWHVRVDYWMADGRVAHLVPATGSPPILEAGQSLRVGNPASGEWFRFEPPGGLELAVAILSTSPLAIADRPRIEPAAGYLTDLSTALHEAESSAVASALAISVTGQ